MSRKTILLLLAIAVAAGSAYLLLELSHMSVDIREDLLQNSPRDMDDPETIRATVLKSNQNLDIE